MIHKKERFFSIFRQPLIKFVQVDTMELKALYTYMSLDVIYESVDKKIQMT